MTKIDSKSRIEERHDSTNVLIVDNTPDTARFMLETLARKGIHAQLATSKKAALDALDRNNCDLAFVTTRLGSSRASAGNFPDGFDLLKHIKATAPEIPIVMMAEVSDSDNATSNGPHPESDDNTMIRFGTQTAVRAIQAGCCDFLLKPLQRETLETLLEALLPNRRLTTVAVGQEGNRTLYQLIGKSPKLARTVALAERIAPTSIPALITGESGTGKELISLLIHHKSKRVCGPFIRVNCAALTDTLLESELFGHEKGAFTGAHTLRKGRFEMAHGGTLLLDEITETTPQFQAKLLRILEQQEFERVGGNENIKVNVRIISTTNRDLLHEVQMGRFRQDLYYRLSAARVVLSPLRERLEDLPELVWHFVNHYAREGQRRIETLDPAMMEIFGKYTWPGNIRQLRNVVVTSLILGVGPTLSLADVSWLFDELQPVTQHGSNRSSNDRWGEAQSDVEALSRPAGVGGIALADLERQAILETLRQTSGNQTKAAKVLGISDRTLREKMRRYRKEECLQPA